MRQTFTIFIEEIDYVACVRTCDKLIFTKMSVITVLNSHDHKALITILHPHSDLIWSNHEIAIYHIFQYKPNFCNQLPIRTYQHRPGLLNFKVNDPQQANADLHYWSQ